MEPKTKYLIPYKSLKAGHNLFDFEADQQLLTASEGSCIKHGHASVTVDAQRSASTVILDVKISGEVVVECDRCLGDLVLPVDYSGRLNVKISETQGQYDGEVMWVFPSDDFIDLKQYIYESVVLSLPLRKIHPDDKAGQPTCEEDMLRRFRIVSQEEFDALDASKTSLSDDPAWEKLRSQSTEHKKGNN